MADVIRLDRYRALTRTPPAVQVHDEAYEDWIKAFRAEVDEELIGADTFYICLNRPLVERIMLLTNDIEAVISGRVSGAQAKTVDLSMSELVDELRHSTHVLWLAQSDHYASLVAEFRRRIERNDRLCDQINRPR